MDSNQVLTTDQMRAAEQALIDAGSSENALMEAAGAGCADWIWRIAAGRKVTVLCGPGNNGGDGYVIARVLAQRGLDVSVIAPMPPKTEAATAAAGLFKGDVMTSAHEGNGEVLVDCLFESGLSRALSEEHSAMLRDLAASHDYRIAVDVPSGVESDSGDLLGEDLPEYDLTLALGAWKPAHFRLPARARMGDLRLVSIGVGAVEGAAHLITPPTIAVPADNAHKYTRGLACVVGGAIPGAALLASGAAQRAGAGYVKLLGKVGNRAVPPSLVTTGKPLDEALGDDRIAALLIGPGLGRDEAAETRLTQVLSANKPTILDADALHLLHPEMLQSDGLYIATPHDGELAALCASFGVSETDRQFRAAALAKESGMVVLAKGPDTILAAPDGTIRIAPPAPSW
ncbi:MAG: NAD(P)H-hydrate epimerase, partial [Marinomonas sp.]